MFQQMPILHFLQLQYKYLGLQSITAAVDAYFGRFYNSVVLSTRLDYLKSQLFSNT